MEFDNLGIILDTSKAHQDLRDIDKKRAETDSDLEKTRQSAYDTWRTAVSVIRGSWMMMRGVMKMMGYTVDTMTTITVNATINLGDQLIRLASAEAMTPGMQAAAIMTAIQAAAVYYSAYQYYQGQEEAKKDLQNANSVLNGAEDMMYAFY